MGTEVAELRSEVSRLRVGTDEAIAPHLKRNVSGLSWDPYASNRRSGPCRPCMLNQIAGAGNSGD